VGVVRRQRAVAAPSARPPVAAAEAAAAAAARAAVTRRAVELREHGAICAYAPDPHSILNSVF